MEKIDKSIPQKILVFAHDSSLYGASLSLLTVLKHFSRNGLFDLLVLLPYKGTIQELLAANRIKYEIIPFPRCICNKPKSTKRLLLNIYQYYKRELKIMSVLENRAKQYNPDLIYTNTSIVSIGYKLAKKMHVPHIWHIREFGDLHFNFHYIPHRRCIAKQIRKSDAAIFVSKVLKKHWAKYDEGKFKIVYNGIVFNNVDINTLRNTSKIFKFGLLGPIITGKGQNIAVKAFAIILKQYPDCELHFYGDVADQEYFQNLQFLISELTCTEKIFFHPFTQDTNSIYYNLNVVLSCSYYEAFGRTIVEAMGRGVPVIANANGGPEEIIDEGVNGLFFKQTPENLAEKMRLLISEPNLYNQISANSIIKARKNFSVEEYVSKVCSIFKETLKIKN